MKSLILLLIAFPALADSYQQASAYTHSYAQSSAQAGAAAGAISGGNTFQGGNTSVTTKTTKQAPTVYAPAIMPTSPCMGGTSAGGSGTGFGLSFGTSWVDDECNTRETARMFHSMGLMSDALAVICLSAYAAAAPSCAGREQPCHADEIVAKRLGVGVCK